MSWAVLQHLPPMDHGDATMTSQSRVFPFPHRLCPSSLLGTWLKAKKCIFLALLLKCNCTPKPVDPLAKYGFLRHSVYCKSSKPNAANFIHVARKAFTCAAKLRSWRLQDQILCSDILQKCCEKY